MYLHDFSAYAYSESIHCQSYNLGDDNHSKNEETKGARNK